MSVPITSELGVGRRRSFKVPTINDVIHLAASGAAGLLAVIAFAAVAQTSSIITYAWQSFPSFLGWKWLAADVIALGAAVLGLAAMIRLRRHRLLIGLALAAILRLGAVALIHAPVVADWERYHLIAIRIASGGPVFDIVPTGWPLALSIPYALFGPQPWLGGLLNAAFGVATAWLVFRLAVPIFGEVVAAAALYLFAIYPDQIFMTPILGTETLYSLLITGATVALFAPGLTPAFVAGVALGASQYVRSTTVFVMVAFLAVLPLLQRWQRRLVAVLIAAAIVFIPVIAHNRVDHGEWSVSTSRFGGWSMLVGTNQEHSGVYNVDDLRLVGGYPETDEGNRVAQTEAIRRITSNPVAFAGLVVRKFNVLWASGDWGIRAADVNAPVAEQRALSLLAQIVYAAIMVLAAAAAWRLRRNPLVALILANVAVMTAVHSIIEVTPRYHAFVMPLLCLMAGTEVVRRFGQPRSEDTSVNQRGGLDDASARATS